MPIPQEVQNWLDNAPLAPELKKQLATEFEKEEAGKYARETVLSRSDYSKKMDEFTKQQQTELAKIQKQQADLAELQEQLSGQGRGWSQEKEKLLREIAATKGRLAAAKERLAPLVDGDVDTVVKQVFGDDDTSPTPRNEPPANQPPVFDPEKYVPRDQFQSTVGNLASAWAKYYNWLSKTQRQYNQLTGEYMDEDAIFQEVVKNPNASYDQIADSLYKITDKRAAKEEARINEMIERRAGERYQEMIAGQSLEGSRRADTDSFTSALAKPAGGTLPADHEGAASVGTLPALNNSDLLKTFEEAEATG